MFKGKKLTPISLFANIILFIIFISLIFNGKSFGNVEVKSLLSIEGIDWYMKNAIKSFAEFRPFYTVMIMMFGIAICEKTGLFNDIFILTLREIKGAYLPIIAVFLGILGNIMSSASFAIMPPITAYIFIRCKRSPIVGIIASFTGVAAGLSANIFITPTDALITEISNQALEKNMINASINISSNWYFMIFSSFILAIVAGIFIYKFVEPKFKVNKEYIEDIKIDRTKNNSGLIFCAVVSIVYFILIGIIYFVKGENFNDSILNKGSVIIIFIWFLILGIIYGIVNKSIRGINDIEKILVDMVKSMGSFIVLCFIASQFILIFNYTNLSKVVSNMGINILSTLQGYDTFVLIIFILVVSSINFFIGSSSAKWLVLAPIFLPMMNNLGIHPIVTQAAYRIADSVTNCISPLEPFLPFIITLCQKYDKNLDMKKIIKTMFPIAMVILSIWISIFLIWYKLGIPFGI